MSMAEAITPWIMVVANSIGFLNSWNSLRHDKNKIGNPDEYRRTHHCKVVIETSEDLWFEWAREDYDPARVECYERTQICDQGAAYFYSCKPTNYGGLLEGVVVFNLVLVASSSANTSERDVQAQQADFVQREESAKETVNHCAIADAPPETQIAVAREFNDLHQVPEDPAEFKHPVQSTEVAVPAAKVEIGPVASAPQEHPHHVGESHGEPRSKTTRERFKHVFGKCYREAAQLFWKWCPRRREKPECGLHLHPQSSTQSSDKAGDPQQHTCLHVHNEENVAEDPKSLGHLQPNALSEHHGNECLVIDPPCHGGEIAEASAQAPLAALAAPVAAVNTAAVVAAAATKSAAAAPALSEHEVIAGDSLLEARSCGNKMDSNSHTNDRIYLRSKSLGCLELSGGRQASYLAPLVRCSSWPLLELHKECCVNRSVTEPTGLKSVKLGNPPNVGLTEGSGNNGSHVMEPSELVQKEDSKDLSEVSPELMTAGDGKTDPCLHEGSSSKDDRKDASCAEAIAGSATVMGKDMAEDDKDGMLVDSGSVPPGTKNEVSCAEKLAGLIGPDAEKGGLDIKDGSGPPEDAKDGSGPPEDAKDTGCVKSGSDPPEDMNDTSCVEGESCPQVVLDTRTLQDANDNQIEAQQTCPSGQQEVLSCAVYFKVDPSGVNHYGVHALEQNCAHGAGLDVQTWDSPWWAMCHKRSERGRKLCASQVGFWRTALSQCIPQGHGTMLFAATQRMPKQTIFHNICVEANMTTSADAALHVRLTGQCCPTSHADQSCALVVTAATRVPSNSSHA